MSKERENPDTKARKKSKLKKDPETGFMVLSGPAFTKKDIARDFPDDNDRDSRIIRSSVGL